MELNLKDLTDQREATILERDDHRVLVALPPGTRTEVVDVFAKFPERISTRVTIHNTDDFIGYVNRFKNQNTTIFVSPNVEAIGKSSVIADAVIDYHKDDQNGNGEAVEPQWGQHRAQLVAAPSLEYAKLLQFNGAGMVPQDVFARSLKDLARFCSSMPAGDLLEIARNIALTSKGNFQNVTDDFSGSVDFQYKVAVTAAVNSPVQNRNLQVPQTINFKLPILEGTEPVEVVCEFRYKIPANAEDSVKLGLFIQEKAWIEKDAITAVANTIRDETDAHTLVATWA